MTVDKIESDNPSWFLYGPKEAKIQPLPVPEIQDPHDVIIQIAYVGVCGSDVHCWNHGGIAKKVSREQPLVLGHEASGIIHAVGPAVTSVEIGDHVALEPGFPCRRCKICKQGNYNLCRSLIFAAVPPDNHGTLTKYYRAPEDFVYKVPTGLSLQEATLAEPLSVAVHSTRLAEITPGQTVVIMGSGTIGLLCGAVAKTFGADRIILVDVLQNKLDFASEYLGCEAFLVGRDQTPEDSAAALLAAVDVPDGVDAVIEASGADSPIQMGVYILKVGGSYVQAGVGKQKAEIPILALSQKELRVRGCFRYGPGDYELAMKLLSKKTVDAKRLITAVLPFEEAPEAWEKTGRGDGVKNLIQVLV
ncbi:chaperonin 10-like protein [Aspergillus avenaceus]|uniref:D-xylulose reductase n=1 Tax=Aspergillus avenaceus TaxID=36643 RepID=A0A5N6U5X9_ASPAV|nr:chaperonin 10-like protein [Aspergillus avenaceus]